MSLSLFQGILSTERGQQALSSFDSCERALIEVSFFSALAFWSYATFRGLIFLW